MKCESLAETMVSGVLKEWNRDNQTMAAQPWALSLKEFHSSFDGAKPAYEYWHGAAIQKSMPTALHGIVQIILAMLLEKAGWNTASEVRLKVVPGAEPVPDIIAVRGKLKGRYPAVAPALCIEILPPGDTLAEYSGKSERLHILGIAVRVDCRPGKTHSLDYVSARSQ